MQEKTEPEDVAMAPPVPPTGIEAKVEEEAPAADGGKKRKQRDGDKDEESADRKRKKHEGETAEERAERKRKKQERKEKKAKRKSKGVKEEGSE